MRACTGALVRAPLLPLCLRGPLRQIFFARLPYRFRVPQHLPLFGREMTVPPMLDFTLARKRRHFVQRAHGVQHFAPRWGRSRRRRGRTKRRRTSHGHAIRARRMVGIRRRRPGIPRCGRRPVVPVVGPVVGSRRRARGRSIHVPVVSV